MAVRKCRHGNFYKTKRKEIYASNASYKKKGRGAELSIPYGETENDRCDEEQNYDAATEKTRNTCTTRREHSRSGEEVEE